MDEPGARSDYDSLAGEAARLQQRRAWPELIAILERLDRLAPGQVAVQVNLGDARRENGDAGGALEAYEAGLRLAPGHPEILNRRGVTLSLLRRFEAALADFSAVLSQAPEHANALANAAIALQQLRRLDEALDHAERAAAAEPGLFNVQSTLAGVLCDLGRYEEGLEAYDRALQIDPEGLAAINNRGNALLEMRRLREALACFDTVLARLSDDPGASWNRATVQLLNGRMEEGWRGLDSRWKGPLKPLYERLPRPLWDGAAPLDGRTLLLHAEQGYGDVIQMVRYAPLAAERGARVVLAVPGPLVALCRSVMGVAEVVADDGALPQADLCCPMMDLPARFGVSLETIPAATPYLKPSARKVVAWAERLGPKSRPRVGIVWSSGVRPDQPDYWVANARRNIPLSRMRPLADAGVQLYSVQKGEPAESELAEPRASKPDGGPDYFTTELHDFEDSAALIESLDLVISVDTATAHLAGALGTPVWILLRHAACWRWLTNRSDSPWYPSARLFRQQIPGDWSGVVAEVGRALREDLPR
jgi:tetratricopeptide (TPR) repeat protein